MYMKCNFEGLQLKMGKIQLLPLHYHFKACITWMQACGPIVHNTSRTIKRWIKRANKRSAADLPRQAYWSGASNCTFVFGAGDIKTLMLPHVLSDEQRCHVYLTIMKIVTSTCFSECLVCVVSPGWSVLRITKGACDVQTSTLFGCSAVSSGAMQLHVPMQATNAFAIEM